MSAISGYINQIQNAVHGEQVRSSIVNALLACYSDVENPDLQSAAFQAAIEAAYQDGILNIIEVTQVSQMTNENIIYRYMGTQAGYMANTLYYHNGTAWVPLGSGVLTASTAAQMTNTDAIYKYTGSETGYFTNTLYYYNGTAWVPISLPTDTTLTIAGRPADAAAVGSALSDLDTGLSNDAKAALINLLNHVAFIDANGATYIAALETALNYGGGGSEDVPDYGYITFENIVANKYIDENGDIVSYNGSSYNEDYFEVSPVGDYYIVTTSGNWRISEYDINKTFIKQTQIKQIYNNATQFTFDLTTKYIRYGWYGGETPQFVLSAKGEALNCEIGNISGTTGENDDTFATRARTSGYIPVTGALSVSHCPIGARWSTSFGYGVRCYSSSKAFLGSVLDSGNMFKSDQTNLQLPTGTAYIRLIFGESLSQTFGNQVKQNIIINEKHYWVTQI